MSSQVAQKISTSTGPQDRETALNAPVIESSNARLEQVGPFRQDNVAVSQTNVDLELAAVGGPVEFVAGQGGKVVGLVARSNADLTAGTATFRATLAGTEAGDATAILSDTVQQIVVSFDTPVAFSAGDALGVSITTDGSFAPITADVQAYLLVRWEI